MRGMNIQRGGRQLLHDDDRVDQGGLKKDTTSAGSWKKHDKKEYKKRPG